MVDIGNFVVIKKSIFKNPNRRFKYKILIVKQKFSNGLLRGKFIHQNPNTYEHFTFEEHEIE
jgi:predicted small secreted protein